MRIFTSYWPSRQKNIGWGFKASSVTSVRLGWVKREASLWLLSLWITPQYGITLQWMIADTILAAQLCNIYKRYLAIELKWSICWSAIRRNCLLSFTLVLCDWVFIYKDTHFKNATYLRFIILTGRFFIVFLNNTVLCVCAWTISHNYSEQEHWPFKWLHFPDPWC